MSKSFAALMVGLIGVASLVGCGGGDSGPPEGRPATVKVTGTVNFKGAPVEGASVIFKAKDKGATGITKADGTFELTTYSAGDGAVPGSYQVGITKTEIVGEDLSYSDVNSPNYGKEIPESARGKKVHHIPEKYNDPAKSGLTADIKEGEATIPPFELAE
ncbi:MAG: hypothetical protein R3C01_08765 [Planctomycetaceae bacterium]